jgi:hypothetical protein
VRDVSRKVEVVTPVLSKRLADDVQELHKEIYTLRDEVLGLQARLAKAEVIIKKYKEGEALDFVMDPAAHVEYLETVVTDLEFQIREIKSSSTWKLGRIFLSPIRIFKR